MLKYLGTKVDNWGWRKKMIQFRSGWPANSVPDIKFYRSPKVQYRYRERGTGQTLVFAADPPVTLELYNDLLDTYAPHFRVIIVELPAMGFSQQQGDYRFGFRETNDDMANFLKSVAGENAVLAFSCVGGLGAVDIAVRYPDLVSKLILIQTADYTQFQKWKAARDPKKILAKPIIGQILMRRLRLKRLPMWLGLAVGKREMLEPFCACGELTINHGAGWTMAGAFQNYMRSGLELGKAQQPILAIWGDLDKSHASTASQSVKNLGKNTQLISYNDLGHFPELEDVPRIFGAIRTFLK